ncbi:hypothetical protein AAMO2058_001147900 [Amorphochlora amoebiformis]
MAASTRPFCPRRSLFLAAFALWIVEGRYVKSRTRTRGAVSPPPQRKSTLIRRRAVVFVPVLGVLSEGLLGTKSRGCADASTSPFSIGDLQQSIFADVIASGMDFYESVVREDKSSAFSSLFSLVEENKKDTQTTPVKLLDVGVGAGPNMNLYKESGLDLRVTGVDPNPYMERYAKQSAEQSEVPFQFQLGDANRLPFPDGSFDVVVSTLVLCSISDPEKALREIERVLKPGGCFFFWEHVKAPPDRPILGFAQTLLSPLQQVYADGCHLDRNTLQIIEQSKLFDSVENVRKLHFNDLTIVAPHVTGVALAKL